MEDLNVILRILKSLEVATIYLSTSKYPIIISSVRMFGGLMVQVRKTVRTYITVHCCYTAVLLLVFTVKCSC